MINICILTSNRSEYGILKELIKKLQNDKHIDLKLIVTGAHFDKKFGYTVNEIRNDKVKIFRNVKIYPKSDKKKDILRFISNSVEKMSTVFTKTNFDYLIILGDRYDLIGPALSAFMNNICIVHISGGDITEGSLDNQIRDIISSVSKIHLVTNKKSAERVKSIKGSNKNIHNLGSLSIERILKTSKKSKKTLSNELGIKFSKFNLLITYHPITNDINTSKIEINEILKALKNFKNSSIFFTYPNNDNGSAYIIEKILDFKRKNKNIFIFKSLGFDNYISLAKNVDLIIGNSSSIVMEIPSLKKPSILIGNRQRGRLLSKNIFNIEGKSSKIKNILHKLKNGHLNNSKYSNPYYKNNTLKKMVLILKDYYNNNLK